jgi:signal transduction histidine kinase
MTARTTSIEPTAPRRRAALGTALGAMRSGRTWRATAHAAVGLVAALGALGVLAGIVFLGVVAATSLVDEVTDPWTLKTAYVLCILAVPAVLLWAVRAFGAMQRARFAELLGVEIPPPPGDGSRWLRWLTSGWRAPATWRQLGYHLLAVVVGAGGGALVVACWAGLALLAVGTGTWRGGWPPVESAAATLLALAMLVAAPWVAVAVARADTVAGRALLGPSRAEQLARRVESLARSRAEVVAATDAERRRIERDLHDGAQQRLVSLAMNLGMARANLTDVPEPARRAIEHAHDEATQALAELRELVRGLHPAVLDDRGLDAALSGIAARAPIPVRLRVDVARRCSPTVEAVAYFVVAESLTNVAKHAQASRVEVAVERAGDRLRIVVTDDGRGGAGLDRGGSGLRGLAQRAAGVDGTLDVDSPTGGPTTITVELPCES